MLYITISYKSTYICVKLTSGDGNVRIAVIMFCNCCVIRRKNTSRNRNYRALSTAVIHTVSRTRKFSACNGKSSFVHFCCTSAVIYSISNFTAFGCRKSSLGYLSDIVILNHGLSIIHKNTAINFKLSAVIVLNRIQSADKGSAFDNHFRRIRFAGSIVISIFYQARKLTLSVRPLADRHTFKDSHRTVVLQGVKRISTGTFCTVTRFFTPSKTATPQRHLGILCVMQRRFCMSNIVYRTFALIAAVDDRQSTIIGNRMIFYICQCMTIKIQCKCFLFCNPDIFVIVLFQFDCGTII